MTSRKPNWIAGQIMNSRVMATTRRAKGQDLALQLLSHGSSGVPVVELTGEVVGIVTEFDLLKAIHSGRDLHDIQAGDIMTELPCCVDEHASAEEVIQKMIEHRILRIPVLRDNKLVGMLSRTDILSHAIDSHLLSVVSS